jgi:histidinol dehydrogenase
MQRLATGEADFAARFADLLQQARATTQDVGPAVAAIIADVRARGDAALCEASARFDRIALTPETLRITAAEIEAATASIDPPLAEALDLAARRIEAFHRAQRPQDLRIADPAGLTLGLRWNALDAVGLYVPGGKAAYPSSVLMNAIPARVAGVARIAMCVPAPDGVLAPLVLAAGGPARGGGGYMHGRGPGGGGGRGGGGGARRAGVDEIYRIGGAQAVAALAFGTASIAPVDRIVGPGNAYVAEAKRQVFGHVGIDSIAGPSEVLILADADNDASLVAIDLLAQAEHDEAAQAILITDDAGFAEAVAQAVERELRSLPRAAIARASWAAHGAIILVRDWEEAVPLANQLAAEHVQIMLPEPAAMLARIRHAGAAFLGRHAPEALGDYVAGPNHVLPTGRSARFASGLSVFDFLKRTTYVAAEARGLAEIGPAAVALAGAEGLHAHALSISRRLG